MCAVNPEFTYDLEALLFLYFNVNKAGLQYLQVIF